MRERLPILRCLPGSFDDNRQPYLPDEIITHIICTVCPTEASMTASGQRESKTFPECKSKEMEHCGILYSHHTSMSFETVSYRSAANPTSRLKAAQPGRRAAMVARLRLGRELGDGYKLIYHGISNRNGVGIIANESFRNSVTAVDRLSDRLMAVKVDTEEVELRVVSAYAPQMGCSEEEKACFWEDLEQYVQSLEGEEVLLIGGDFNGHVGSRKDGFESCHGGYGFGARNDDGL
ncbi:hypothetical protein RB195_018799 [Necator americanus]|uniref:Endonuclease/exonuclease/phosphatase domain-containing protein n=1 Tax=Necator americanus TaxID=51031 RepID=A0ABR1CDG7_NECAM